MSQSHDIMTIPCMYVCIQFCMCQQEFTQVLLIRPKMPQRMVEGWDLWSLSKMYKTHYNIMIYKDVRGISAVCYFVMKDIAFIIIVVHFSINNIVPTVPRCPTSFPFL